MSIKEKYLQDETNEDFQREINFAINNIAERRIYQTSTPTNIDSPLPENARKSSYIMEGWLNEYSDANNESSSSSSVRAAKL